MNVARIEKELRELWKGFSANNAEQPVTRAQVMNLIVYTDDPVADAKLSQILAEISEESPGRLLVLLQDNTLPSNEWNAWVNALCHLASGGRKQICSEQIMIHAGKLNSLQWSSVVVPLIVPDLPVFLWWTEPVDRHSEILLELVKSADRLIIDSAQSNRSSVIKELMNQARLAISDLNWGRLTPWRLIIATFYDHPQCRPCLEEITRIEIECSSPFADSMQSELLLGWLASSLSWQSYDRSQMSNSNGSPITLDVQCSTGPSDQMKSIRLHSSCSEFLVTLTEDKQFLRSEIKIDGHGLGAQLIRLLPEDIAQMIARELSIMGHDHIYEKAIRSIL